MESRRSTDLAGILQLVGFAAVFAGIAVSVASLSAHPGPVGAIVIGVVAAAAGVFVQFSEWERQGGRAAIVTTNKWIRARAIPSTVPREIWMPRLRQREARALKQWMFLLIVVIEIPLSVITLLDSETVVERMIWICALAFWTALIGWTLYYNLRVLPVIRRLLRQAHTVEADSVSEDRGIRSPSHDEAHSRLG